VDSERAYDMIIGLDVSTSIVGICVYNGDKAEKFETKQDAMNCPAFVHSLCFFEPANCPNERVVIWGIDDLKSFAAARCIDIFNDFDKTEIAKETTSVREAWDIGRQIEDIYR